MREAVPTLGPASRPTAETLYGLDDPATADYGTRCLTARRLVERDVRFVQVGTKNREWDHHSSIRTGLPAAYEKTDQPAALVRDLKDRGLMDTTAVMWGGEMGRLPVIEDLGSPAKVGRGHNTSGVAMWFAGDGVTHHDRHASLPHLSGLGPAKLVFSRNGAERTLLDGHPG